MSNFVIVANPGPLNERQGPGTNFALTGTTHTFGSVLSSLETRTPNASAGTWERVGTNRWVNRTIPGGVHMVAASTATGDRIVNAVANIRRGPGTSFPIARTLANGTRVTRTHTATPPSAVTTTTGNWTRIGNREWIHSPLLSTAPATTPPPVNGTRVQLAQQIMTRFRATSGRRILMPEWASNMTMANRRAARANMEDTANGNQATTPFGRVNLSADMLSAILRISDINANSVIQINAIAGGNHVGGAQDPHALGFAVDFQSTNHVVNGTSRRPAEILTILEGAGFRTQRNHRGSNYVGDANHFHLEIWNGR